MNLCDINNIINKIKKIKITDKKNNSLIIDNCKEYNKEASKYNNIDNCKEYNNIETHKEYNKEASKYNNIDNYNNTNIVKHNNINTICNDSSTTNELSCNREQI